MANPGHNAFPSESNTTAISPLYRPRGVALIAGFGFFAAAGCAVDALVFGGELVAGFTVFPVSGFVGTFFGKLGFVLSEIGVGAGAGAVGMGLLRLKRWAWVMGALVVGLNFAFVPVLGLALLASDRWDFLLVVAANVTTLVVLHRPEVKKAFNAPGQYIPLFLALMAFVGVGVASLLIFGVWLINQ